MHLTSHITHSNGYAPYIAYYRSNGYDQRFRKLKPKPKLNPPNAHRSQIKICENRQTQNVQFRLMPNAFRILKPIQKSSKRVWVFRNTGANAFAKNQMRLAYEGKRDLYCTPTLQHMFALARRMGYEMHPIARQPDAQRQLPGNRSFSDQNRGFRSQTRTGRDYSKIKCFSCGQFVDICRPVARNRTLRYHLNQRVGTFNPTVVNSGMVITNRETLHRPGPHPHRSVHTSFDPTSSSSATPSSPSSPPDNAITSIHQQSISCTETCASSADGDHTKTHEVPSHDVMDGTSVSRTALQSISLDQTQPRPVTRSVGRSVDWSRTVDDQLEEEAIMQISGAGHWFLEGWIGDHSVDFLVKAGAQVGALRPTPSKLRVANGSQIDILVCDSGVSTDAIIGTDTLGSILPHTLDIKHGLMVMEGGVPLQLHRRDSALSGRVFTVGHCLIPPYFEVVLHCTLA